MYLITALGLFAFLLAIVITPFVRNIFLRLDLVDRPDALRKFHPYPIPRVGGVVIGISYILAFSIALALPFSFKSAVEESIPRFWRVLPAAEMIFITGLIDDVVGLRPWQKLVGQLVAALIAYAGGVRVESVAGYALDPWVSLSLSVIWLISCTNAFNLIDGMDGLATGVGLFATATMFLAALTHNSLDLALVTVPLIGSLLGFLRYNFNPASAFLGDSGSLLIGFMLGCFGALWSQKTATVLGVTAPLMAMSIPLLDATLAIARRFIRKRPLFTGDRGHMHHRLLDLGLTPRRAALLMYAVCGLATVFSLLQDAFNNQFGGLIIFLFSVTVWIGIQHLGYVEFGIARQIFVKGTFRRIIDDHTRLKHFEQNLLKTHDVNELWNVLATFAKDFGFARVEARLGTRDFFCGEILQDHLCSLRVPVHPHGYIEFSRTFTSDIDAVPIATFLAVVQLRVNQKLTDFSRYLVKHVTPGGQSGVAYKQHGSDVHAGVV